MPISIPHLIIAAPLALGLGVGLQVADGPQRVSQAEARDPAPRWSPPLQRPLEVSGAYRAPEHRYGQGHRGIDIPAAPGEAVSAPVSGVVSFAGRVVDRDVVTMRVDATTLVSLEPVATEIGVGDAVLQGTLLGKVTAGGHCDGECVHLGVRVGTEPAGRDYVNPLRFYLDKPVLLPW